MGSQIEPLNTALHPHLRKSNRPVQAFEEAKSRGIGAITFEGRMIDEMSYQQAKQRLSLAELIEEKTKQWREPYIRILYLEFKS
jgi:citrate lyase beta subunit